MREIKFRGWHAGQNKMYYPEQMAYDQLTLLPTGEFINVHGKDTSLSTIYPTDKFIPLQYTGLKDKNDKEIYEGDILSPSKRVVEYCTDVRLKSVYETYGGAGFYTRAYKTTGRPEELGVFSFGITQAEVSEIIGNIYSNPELLKEHEK